MIAMGSHESKRLLLVAATEQEAESARKLPGFTAGQGNLREMSLLVAGVGSVSTSWELQKWFAANQKPDLAINIGIAGSYRQEIGIGDVVMPVTDCFAGQGVEDGDKILTLFEAGLAAGDQFPFTDGVLRSDPLYSQIAGRLVRPVHAITVSMATGSEATRDRLVEKFNPDIETMEGATFFYICRREHIPFIALRSVSNMVEKRNRERWDIPGALESLSAKLNDIIQILT